MDIPALHDPTICLDFSNTLDGARSQPTETLFSYADLIAWCRTSGLVDAPEGADLLGAAERQPAAAAPVFERAIALRETIYRLMSAVAAERTPAADDLTLLNAELATGAPHLAITHGYGYGWAWRLENEVHLDRPLWALARATADLLTGEQIDRVRECASATCDWLFIDRSKNSSRRWCDMGDCGNRAKARRHYARQRAARTGA